MKLDFSDTSACYYGDYHRVCIEVKCALPHEDYARWHLFKKLERMGVDSASLDSAKQELLDAFTGQIMPYLQREDFPQRFAEARKKKRFKTA
jgi:hypothetical protein